MTVYGKHLTLRRLAHQAWNDAYSKGLNACSSGQRIQRDACRMMTRALNLLTSEHAGEAAFPRQVAGDREKGNEAGTLDPDLERSTQLPTEAAVVGEAQGRKPSIK